MRSSQELSRRCQFTFGVFPVAMLAQELKAQTPNPSIPCASAVPYNGAEPCADNRTIGRKANRHTDLAAYSCTVQFSCTVQLVHSPVPFVISGSCLQHPAVTQFATLPVQRLLQVVVYSRELRLCPLAIVPIGRVVPGGTPIATNTNRIQSTWRTMHIQIRSMAEQLNSLVFLGNGQHHIAFAKSREAIAP